jgi:hypothetical protein
MANRRLRGYGYGVLDLSSFYLSGIAGSELRIALSDESMSPKEIRITA